MYFSFSLSLLLPAFKKNYAPLVLRYLELNNKQNQIYLAQNFRKQISITSSFFYPFKMNILSCFIFPFVHKTIRHTYSFLLLSRLRSVSLLFFGYIFFSVSNFLNCLQMQFNLAILFVVLPFLFRFLLYPADFFLSTICCHFKRLT